MGAAGHMLALLLANMLNRCRQSMDCAAAFAEVIAAQMEDRR
jgi:hypothetical protein